MERLVRYLPIIRALNIVYQEGVKLKANVVADALSKKSTGSLDYIQTIQLPLMVKLRELGVELRCMLQEHFLLVSNYDRYL